ncbi:hypothetical protein NC652_021696 [Populus alba x Populus x berolinensis]|nr:hypothetical protein NC652_021696 [Populus alba x Populus x berolinensis]
MGISLSPAPKPTFSPVGLLWLDSYSQISYRSTIVPLVCSLAIAAGFRSLCKNNLPASICFVMLGDGPIYDDVKMGNIIGKNKSHFVI